MAHKMCALSICQFLFFVSTMGQETDPPQFTPEFLDEVQDLVSIENDDEDPPTNTTNITVQPEVSPSLRWEHCKLHRHISMLSLARAPKQSAEKGKTTGKPRKTVDTFYPIDCVGDAMFDLGGQFADKRHLDKVPVADGMFSARLTASRTVLHYKAVVPRKEQKPMTPRVCFSFCRHMEDMYFFGITKGSDCYCAPYFLPTSDDMSSCDAVCDGDPKLSCGGQSKSSMFEMHTCADTEHVLRQAESRLRSILYGSSDETHPPLKLGLQGYSQMLNRSASVASESCGLMQNYFVKVHDLVAADLMKRCKLHASEVQYKAWLAMDLVEEGKRIKPEYGNFEKFDIVSKAEKQIAALEALILKVETMAFDLNTLYDKFKPPEAPPFSETLTTVKVNDTLKQQTPRIQKAFAPAMSYVDASAKEWMPSVCGGALAEEPSVASERECRDQCSKVSNCAGFSHFEGVYLPMCFLFSKLETVSYYPHCPRAKARLEPQAFLQIARTDSKEPVFRARCQVKSSKFGGASLKPDPSGKCKHCFTKVITKSETKSLCSPARNSR